jgi:hypothetical protein
MPAAPRMYLIVVYRPMPAAPLAVRCMYMAVVPGPMPAAVASWGCRRIFKSRLAPAARSAKTDTCGRSFAVLSTQVSAAGLRLGWRVVACLKGAATLSQQEKNNSPVVQRRRVNIALSVH